MATPQENLARFQEISNRGLQDKLDPNMRARFDEALNRGLINQQPGITGSVAPPPLPGVSSVGAEVITPPPPEPTRAVKELPELGSGGLLAGEDKFKIAKVSAALLVTTKPKEIADILEANFENIARQSDEQGNILLVNRETGARVVVNKPGLSKIDVLQGLGLVAAFTGPGKLATIPAKLATKAAAGVGAAGLTQSAIEGIQAALGGEINKEEIALAAAFGGATELAIPAIQALRQRRVAGVEAKDLGVARAEVPEAAEAVGAAQEAITGLEKATGKEVGLFPGQQTQQASTLIKQRILPQLDASSRQAGKALEVQNKEVFEATTELIARVAPDEALEVGAERFRTAAKTAVDATKEARQAAAGPLFQKAFKEGADVDLGPINAVIDDFLEDASPVSETFKAMTKIKALIGEKPSLRKLEKARLDMGKMLSNFGSEAIDNVTKREVVQVKNALVDQMELSSDSFRQAMERFRELSPSVSALENSIIGKLSNVDDVALDTLSQRIFGGTKVSPQNIKSARKLIENADPGAWNDILRVELQRRVGAMASKLDDVTGELIGNIPGDLKRALFGQPQQRQALLAGMNTTQRQNFLYLEATLDRAAKGRAAGSPTASFQQVINEMKGPVRVFVDAIFRPKQTALKTGDDALLNINASKMADMIFNPKWEPKFKELRGLNPTSKKAEKIFREIFEAAKPAVQVQQLEAAREEDRQ